MQRANLDTLDALERGLGVYVHCFLQLEHEPKAEQAISDFRLSVEARLQQLDAVMSEHLTEHGERTVWAVRTGECGKRLRTLTMNLPFWGKPEWSWPEVAEAMAYLRVVIEGAEATIGLNGWNTAPEEPQLA